MNEQIKDFKTLNGIKLAYIGDAVYSLYIRTHFVKNTDYKNTYINKKVNSIVCAKNQAKKFDEMFNELTEEEIEVAKHARNCHVNNIAKNSTPLEYSKATQFEAVLGYLYLNNDIKRLEYFINKSLEEN